MKTCTVSQRAAPASEPYQVLRARAQELARRPEPPADEGARLEVLEFRLGQERYALEARFVSEVHSLQNLTPLPCTPPFMRGIANVRGRITPVIDIKKLLGLPDEGLMDLHRIILLRAGDLELGLLADVIVGVRTVPAGTVRPSLATKTGIRGELFVGVTTDRLVVLDAQRILADPAIIVDEEPVS